MQMHLQHQRDHKNVFKHIIKIQLDHNNLRRVVETLRKGASVLPLPPPLTVETFSSFRNYVTVVHAHIMNTPSRFYDIFHRA